MNVSGRIMFFNIMVEVKYENHAEPISSDVAAATDSQISNKMVVNIFEGIFHQK